MVHFEVLKTNQQLIRLVSFQIDLSNYSGSTTRTISFQTRTIGILQIGAEK